ncbi:MAG: hypothetical protein AMJ58_00895 [Gammaproteobacteria bacterium SG8_30]|nr:MAG: hypothetical protein AMJ58_00895 [Gammaproteobacteria bacterium SG8_30]
MLRKIRNALVRGLVVVLPIALTVWLLWWLGSSTEALLHQLIVVFVPAEYYRPGMGIAAALVLLIGAGVLVNAFIVRRMLAAWEALMERIPIVKSIYGAVRDFVQILPAGGGRSELKRVVLARIGEASAIGFVTRDDARDMAPGAGVEGQVAVYFPMSYQIGGYTLLLPRSRIEPLDIPIETAMRLVLTGGMSGAAPRP